MSNPAPAAARGDLLGTVRRVAWMSVLLGVGMEVVLVFLAAGFGKSPVLGPVLADLVQKVSWSLLVCAGLSLGTALTRAQVPGMGLAGLLSAPAAFNLSRAIHKGASQALSVAAPAAAAPSPAVLSLLKAIEYGCLGAAIGWLGKRPEAGAWSHVAVGFAVGVLFGGTILVLAWPLPPAALLARGINEVLFPVGCSLVLFSAGALGKRLAGR